MAGINKEDAEIITKKLEGEKREKRGKKHVIVQIYHNGILIAHYGISRSSNRNSGHGHIPSQIHVSPRQAQLISQCHWYRNDWLEELERKGKL